MMTTSYTNEEKYTLMHFTNLSVPNEVKSLLVKYPFYLMCFVKKN